MSRIGENTPEDTLYRSNEYQVESRNQERRTKPEREERVTTAAFIGSSTLELLAAGAAIVLAIVGLTGSLVLLMSATATIAVGVALFAHGAVVAARFHATLRRIAPGHEHRAEVGVGAEILGGAAAVALGILALANCQSFVLIPIASIVIGGSILLGARVQTNIAALEVQIGRFTFQAVEVTRSALVLAGAGAVVLGILALINVAPALCLSLVAMLTVAGALLLVGGTLTARFARILHHEHDHEHEHENER